MKPEPDWRELIPHRGAMCLLDALVDWDAKHLHARANSHRDPTNPLRSDGLLRGVHLCEYGAQAMAIHGGLLARAARRAAVPGLLVSLHAVSLQVERIDDLGGALDVFVEQLLDGGSSWQYAFRVTHAGAPLADGRAAVARVGRGFGPDQ